MEVIPTVSEIIGISDHLGGFLFRRGCPGEKAWFSPRSTPAMGSLTRVVPQPPTPPGLTTSPQASLPARPAVGLSATGILSDGSGGIEPPRRSAVLPCPEVQGLPRTLVIRCLVPRVRLIDSQYTVPGERLNDEIRPLNRRHTRRVDVNLRRFRRLVGRIDSGEVLQSACP